MDEGNWKYLYGLIWRIMWATIIAGGLMLGEAKFVIGDNQEQIESGESTDGS